MQPTYNISETRAPYKFYRHPRLGDTFKKRTPTPEKSQSIYRYENPSPPVNRGLEIIASNIKASYIKPNETKTYTEQSTLSQEDIEKVRIIASQLFAPCPSSHPVCFRESNNFCLMYDIQCIGEMGTLKQDALRKRLYEIDPQEIATYSVRNFKGFSVQEWFENPEMYKEFKPNSRLLEGEDLENELEYLHGDRNIRNNLLLKAMEKLKRSEAFTAALQERLKPTNQPSRSLFEKVKEGVKKLFS